MGVKSKGQVWECPICHWRYEPVLPCIEMLCRESHPGAGKRVMKLIEGDELVSKKVPVVP